MEYYFSGTIERIIFENPSSFFRILLLDISDTDAEDFDDFEIIVTGTMADIMEGEDYTFWGVLVHHPKYGEQLKISRYERAKPSSKGLVKYFSSDHFKGIGLKTAQKIVDLYGDDTIDKILEAPEKLEEITGLSKKNRLAFVEKLRQNYGTERILVQLANYGIPNKLAFQIQDFYKEETLQIVEQQPYRLDLRKKQDLPILLAAPTGRAARRMNELTGLPSATIHRHLGMTGDDDTSHLEDYLDADFIIVDEFSMVDTWLANQLLSNIATDTKLLIVGDADQLPSVSPGQVLADLLQIPSIPQTKLEHIFRQSEDSTIVSLAGDIRQGKLPQDFTERKADRSYFEAGSEHIPKMIEQITSAALRSQIPARDIQVLAPMYKGQAGIDNINTLMQDLLNPAVKDQVVFDTPDCQYRDGDKVIHLVNDAESNVFNGDIGYITDLLPGKYTESKQDELTIQFDGNEIVYPRNEWYKIRLAYAMSIHKSQGSEFPVVILPITNQSHRMLQRNLIYTAITRSKSKLILLGEYSAFDYATKNTGTARKTYLVERFKDLDGGETTKDSSSAVATSSATVESTRSTKGTVERKAEPDEPTVYRLTEDNLHTISPMIGLTEEEIAAFFDIKKYD